MKALIGLLLFFILLPFCVVLDIIFLPIKLIVPDSEWVTDKVLGKIYEEFLYY